MKRSKFSIYIALASNIVIAITKFIAGSISRSASMVSEGIHSLADCFNELFLLVGIRKSNKKRDDTHPFGYGRELYFWSFLVAVMIFGFGAMASFLQGYFRLAHPTLPVDLFWTYIVLALSFLFDGFSFVIALKAFNRIRGDTPFWKAIRNSKDPSTFMVLLEDGASVMGVVVVLLCLFAGEKYHNRYMDGIGSMVIGGLLCLVSFILGKECRSLILGEGISKRKEKDITAIVRKDPDVRQMHQLFSIYQSPEEVLILLLVAFNDNLSTHQINRVIARLKKSIAQDCPEIHHIIIEPWTPEPRIAVSKN